MKSFKFSTGDSMCTQDQSLIYLRRREGYMNENMLVIALSLAINAHCPLAELRVESQEVGNSRRKNDKLTQQQRVKSQTLALQLTLCGDILARRWGAGLWDLRDRSQERECFDSEGSDMLKGRELYSAIHSFYYKGPKWERELIPVIRAGGCNDSSKWEVLETDQPVCLFIFCP